MPTLQEFLLPQVVTRVVSQIREHRGKLSEFYGFLPNRYAPESGAMGPNTNNVPTRSGTIRQFDHSRKVSNFRAPSTGPGTMAPQVVGEFYWTCARIHPKMRLEWEMLGNLSPVIGPNSQIDQGGQDYIMRQTRFMAEQIFNGIEIMSMGMSRGKMFLKWSGDDIIPTLTQPSAGTMFSTINWNIPTGNTLKLNMLGAGDIITTSWDNPAALIFGNLMSIQSAFVALHGWPLTDALCSSVMWNNIVNNTQIRNIGGSANTTFASYDFQPEMGLDGTQLPYFYAVLRAIPWLRWHIIDDVMTIDGTDTKTIPDTNIIFASRPSPEWCELYQGGEYVSEQPGQPASLRMGWHFWSEYVTQPSVMELIGLFNGLPIAYIPKMLVFATPVF